MAFERDHNARRDYFRLEKIKVFSSREIARMRELGIRFCSAGSLQSEALE